MIHCKLIYEKVSLKTAMEQRRFFNYLNDTLCELFSLYNGNLIYTKEYISDSHHNTDEPILVMSLDDYLPLRHIYIPAIVDNIVFLNTGEEFLKTEFLRKSNDAFLSAYGSDARGRHIKRSRW